MVNTKEELRTKQYDNPEVIKKWSDANKRRFAENPGLRFSIIKKAQEARRKAGLEKFKTNPTRKISKRGYWMIYVPIRGWMKEHHYIWEQTNPPVIKGFILHHINFNKLDNRIENLQVMTQSEHMALHTKISNEQNKEKFREYARSRKRDNSGRFI